MTLTRPTLALAALLALAAPLAAQDTAAPAPEATGEATTETTTAETPVTGEPQVGQTYIRETHGAFELRCVKLEEGQEDPCALYQLLSNAQGRAVAEFSIFRLPEGQRAFAGATIVAPLETLLTEQVQMRIDGGEVKIYPFTFCNAGGCLARLGFTEDEVAQLRRGAAAEIRLVSAAAPDRPVLLPLSLSGFTAGFAEVGERK